MIQEKHFVHFHTDSSKEDSKLTGDLKDIDTIRIPLEEMYINLSNQPKDQRDYCEDRKHKQPVRDDGILSVNNKRIQKIVHADYGYEEEMSLMVKTRKDVTDLEILIVETVNKRSILLFITFDDVLENNLDDFFLDDRNIL